MSGSVASGSGDSSDRNLTMTTTALHSPPLMVIGSQSTTPMPIQFSSPLTQASVPPPSSSSQSPFPTFAPLSPNVTANQQQHSQFALEGNRSLFPHLDQLGSGWGTRSEGGDSSANSQNWNWLPTSPNAFDFTQFQLQPLPGSQNPSLGARSIGEQPPQFTILQSPVQVGNDGDEIQENTIPTHSSSHFPQLVPTQPQPVAAAAAIPATFPLSSVDISAVARDMSMSMSHERDYDGGDNPLESEVANWKERDDDEQEEEDDEMNAATGASNKKRKLSNFQGSIRPKDESPLLVPPSARVCELGFLNKQVSGNLCWTSYQKVSATDRSCLALLCPQHADENVNNSPAALKYTQFVPTAHLLQLGLTIERKPLEKTLLALIKEKKIDSVLIMRIRRAVPGRVKTGPEYCQLLLFSSVPNRLIAENALAAHVLSQELRIGFPAALVPFSCDFTRRCVWLVPKQLCVGGQVMLPPEAGVLHSSLTPPQAAYQASLSAAAGAGAAAATNQSLTTVASTPVSAFDTPSTPYGGQSISTSNPAGPSSIAAASAGGVSSQLPLFSALSLHAPPSLEDATYVRVISTLKSTHRIMSLTSEEDPYSQLQLAFNDLEREIVNKFKKFPAREAIFKDELTVDLFISKSTFLNHALNILFDFQFVDEAQKQAEHNAWNPSLQSLFAIISLPAMGVSANSLTFTQFFRLYAWLRPDIHGGWTKPAASPSSIDSDENVDEYGWSEAEKRVNPATGRSIQTEYIMSEVFKLLTFLHRSVKFFQGYIKKANKYVFATRKQLEEDGRFQKFQAAAALHAQQGNSADGMDAESTANTSSVGSASSLSSASSSIAQLLFIPQLRFCEGHIGHVVSDSQQVLFRQIILSYTWADPASPMLKQEPSSDGNANQFTHKMEHVPLLRNGAQGFYVFKPSNEPAANLNFLTPSSPNEESALIELARFMHTAVLHSKKTRMDDGTQGTNEYGAAAVEETVKRE